MATRERPVDRGRERGRQLLADLGREIREARLSHDLSQQSVAQAVGLSDTRISLIERGQVASVGLLTIARLSAAVGLELGARLYPAGQPIRDAAHLELLARLRSRLPARVRWGTEVPLPRPGDQRAWDGFISGAGFTIGVEAETRIRDLQALTRRIALKKRDGDVTRVVLLVRDSRWNRTALKAYAVELAGTYPVTTDSAMRALAVGRDPGGDAIVCL